MRLLQAEGLLTAEHDDRRARVAPLDPKDIDAVYASRILFEALAIRLTVPGMTTADHQALRADLEAMREAGDAQDLRAWEPVHRDFHRRLLQGSESMERIIDPILDRSERYRRSSLFGSRRARGRSATTSTRRSWPRARRATRRRPLRCWPATSPARP